VERFGGHLCLFPPRRIVVLEDQALIAQECADGLLAPFPRGHRDGKEPKQSESIRVLLTLGHECNVMRVLFAITEPVKDPPCSAICEPSALAVRPPIPEGLRPLGVLVSQHLIEKLPRLAIVVDRCERVAVPEQRGVAERL
jgi:hypothetical protein